MGGGVGLREGIVGERMEAIVIGEEREDKESSGMPPTRSSTRQLHTFTPRLA